MLPLLLLALAGFPAVPTDQQEPVPEKAEQVSDEVYTTAKALCGALRQRDAKGFAALTYRSFKATGLGPTPLGAQALAEAWDRPAGAVEPDGTEVFDGIESPESVDGAEVDEVDAEESFA